MKLFIVIVLSVVFFSCASTQKVEVARSNSASLLPQSTPIEDSLHSLIDRIFDDSVFSPCFIGAKIIVLQDRKVLYERNSKKLFHPASNMKLLTTATALNALGAQYSFTSSVSSDGKIKHGILTGNLYIKGTGDPLIRTDDLDTVAAKIARHGITTIKGDLVGDITFFDSVSWGAGWMWDDEPSSDAAFITPLTINANSIDVYIKAGRRNGRPGVVSIEPKTNFVHVLNTSITSPDTSLQPLAVSRVRNENTITIQGRVLPDTVTRHFTLSVSRPELYFLELLRQALFNHGIKVKGKIKIGHDKGNLLLVEVRHPLDSVLHQINKPSDNLAAENLLKTLSAHEQGDSGTASHGLSIVKRYLAQCGVDTAAMILADGSGLSSYNAISPEAMINMLTAIHEDKRVFQEFYESLPIAGIDGTLKNRMKGTRAAGNVHAKTGTLTGVSAVSGYVTAASGSQLAFSIMCNHFPHDVGALRIAQDKILEILAAYNISQNK